MATRLEKLRDVVSALERASAAAAEAEALQRDLGFDECCYAADLRHLASRYANDLTVCETVIAEAKREDKPC